MKKRAVAIVSSLLVLSCAFPAFAAAKHVYTDMDSGFSVQTVNPVMEYASKYSYGFQENSSTTDSLTSIAAIPADVVEKKTGRPFSTKEFMAKLAMEMNKKSGLTLQLLSQSFCVFSNYLILYLFDLVRVCRK